MSRFEIEIPEGLEEEFRRKLPQEFAGAQILKDENLLRRSKQAQKDLLLERVAAFATYEPENEEVAANIRDNYLALYRALYGADLKEIPNSDNLIQVRDRLLSAFEAMPTTDNQRVVLIERYGLGDGVRKTQRQVGQLINYSSGRVAQFEGKTMRRLRHPARRRLLFDPVDA